MRSALALFSAAALAFAALAPSTASACGGVFCDRPNAGQPPMPVDQSGENVLFVVDGGKVEAHVQIQYKGNPERFAWVVPVPKEPKITAGSQRLFTNLLSATGPTFQVQNTFAGGCGSAFSSSSSSVGCGASSAEASDLATPSAARGNTGAAGANQGGIDVIARASVGSYQTVTLGNGTADQLLTWLNDNNFETPDRTASLLTSYLEQGYVFVAIKLNAGAGLDEIHPIVFTYEGDQPCVPLKLTAVAATENMGVRTFFLGQQRFAPKNYKHVVLNDLLFDWTIPNRGQSQINYNQVLTLAVDSDLAMGQAFVTEFAGATSQSVTLPAAPPNFNPVVTTLDKVLAGSNNPSTNQDTRLFNAQWTATPYKTADLSKTVELLKSQGLLSCGQNKCTSVSPLLFPLLSELVTLPAGTSPEAFYSCPGCFPAVLKAGFNSELFSSELEERIIGPARHADELVRTKPYLTRLFTTISPAEMTADPEFVSTPRADINQARVATQQGQCDGSAVMLVNKSEVGLGATTSTWPTFSPSMPAAQRIEQYNNDGSVVVLRDNSAAIDAELAASNKTHNWPPQPEFTVEKDSCALGFGPVRERTTSGAFFGLAAALLVARRLRRS